jgi:hypothetical protein
MKGNAMKSRHLTVLFAMGLLICGAVKAAEPSMPEIVKVKGAIEMAERTQEASAGQVQKLKRGCLLDSGFAYRSLELFVSWRGHHQSGSTTAVGGWRT